jgi:hypothetical protein
VILLPLCYHRIPGQGVQEWFAAHTSETANPDATIKIADDQKETVAEIEGHRAIAVIERSEPQFHRRTRETCKVLRGCCSSRMGHPA